MRAGDSPRNMTQKVIAGRAGCPDGAQASVRVRVDQVVVTRRPQLIWSALARTGLRRTAVETAVAYDARCVTGPGSEPILEPEVLRELLKFGVLVGRSGLGFPGPVHLERFAAPARLVLTDEPRLALLGGTGTLALTSAPMQLVEALTTGYTTLRAPRSLQILLSGKLRPLVSVRDVALELLRGGLKEAVSRIDCRLGAPVVLEFSGPSVRALSVSERSTLAAIAPEVGAISSIFVADEKTEAYLRDQKRSKAHRHIYPDAGAPCDEVLTLDISSVDPMVQDATGTVRPVRELTDCPVDQVVLGGDSGAGLRDLLAAALLLRSKRVPPRLDFILAPPSRQMLEVLARVGALADLIACGARLIEPDGRLLTGELHPPSSGALSLRNFAVEPGVGVRATGCAVASTETLACAVATGKISDPRNLRRSARVTLPRVLPTDEVLLLRKPTAKGRPEPASSRVTLEVAERAPWAAAVVLNISDMPPSATTPTALRCDNPESLRGLLTRTALPESVRAVLAQRVPTWLVGPLTGAGILVLQADESSWPLLTDGARLELPALSAMADDGTVSGTVDGRPVTLRWAAQGTERQWLLGSNPRTSSQPRSSRGEAGKQDQPDYAAAGH